MEITIEVVIKAVKYDAVICDTALDLDGSVAGEGAVVVFVVVFVVVDVVVGLILVISNFNACEVLVSFTFSSQYVIVSEVPFPSIFLHI